MKILQKPKFSTFWQFEISLLKILEQKFSMKPTKKIFEAKFWPKTRFWISFKVINPNFDQNSLKIFKNGHFHNY